MNNIIVLMGYDVTNGIIIITGYALLLLTSGVLVRLVLSKISHKEKKEIAPDNLWDTGAVIGKCENILIITFILSNEFTALAIIFAAKTIIRKDDIEKNSLFYLAGNMINVTYSIVFGVILKLITGI
ncbi:hypothetical protein Metbo_1371 [Methanobacterium lacus]|jgi:hypothetical protein|uniref:Uncharacterized protein n=1 Tax=Methanobacterium lacus (strain AL-21) TaxID=877455 RepID=F0T7P3_METLA|nr:hypothetical protein [Methanobacterium lacus]ADZ09611.1 hypothetical protein Metbo_1371 [Methanobacterium lacus]